LSFVCDNLQQKRPLRAALLIPKQLISLSSGRGI
jgi:hypothetical protein